MRILSLLCILCLWSGTLAAADPTVVQERFRVFFTQGILVPDASSARTLRAVASLAATLKEPQVQVHGYADRFGEPEDNIVLSRDRATVVKRALVELGIAEAIIRDQAHGERDLLIATRDGVSQPLNRRVEIIVQGKLERNPVDDLLPLAHLESEDTVGSPVRP